MEKFYAKCMYRIIIIKLTFEELTSNSQFSRLSWILFHVNCKRLLHLRNALIHKVHFNYLRKTEETLTNFVSTKE